MQLPMGALLLLYFLAYAPFSGLAKWLGEPAATLPTSVLGASAAWALYLALSGQWRRSRFGDPAAWLAACGGCLILCASTVMYGLPGVSIILPLLLCKGLVLPMAPALDLAGGTAPAGRHVAVASLALLAVAVGAWHRVALDSTAAALCCAGTYLCGYALKLRAVGLRRGSWEFLVSETTLTLLVAAPASLLVCLLSGAHPSHRPAALLLGVFSQGCGVFGGLILVRGAARTRARTLRYLVPQPATALTASTPALSASVLQPAAPPTHTLLVPLNRCASLLAGLCAALALGWLRGGWRGLLSATAPSELAGAALLCAALWVGTRRQ